MGGSTSHPGLVEIALNGRFDDVSLVASGGDGFVYRARQRSTRRVVAVKVLSGRHLESSDAASEVSVHASVADHPNVLSLYDADTTVDGVTYLVCEFAPSSMQRLVRAGPTEPREAVRIGAQIADALAFIHRRNIVHGDISPSNVLIGLDGRPRVADFGASVRRGATPPTLDPVRGSLPYVAPEVIEGARPTEASDVYGIAVVVWALLEGRAPFGDDHGSVAGAVANIGSTRVSFDHLRVVPELRRAADALEAATHPDPGQRPPATELAARLVATPPAMLVATPDPPSRRGRLALAVTATVVAIGGGLAFAATDGGQAPSVTPASRSELCSSFEQAQTVARNEMRLITDDLRDVAAAPTVAVEQFLAIPNRFAERARPVLRAAATDPRTEGWVSGLTDDQLRRLILSDAAAKLSSGRFLLDDLGQPTSAIGGVPEPLKDAVASYSSVMSFARGWCPDVDVGLVDSKTALVSAIGGLLDGPDSPFFAQLETADRIDELTVEIMMTTGGDYFEQLLAAHPAWLLALLDHRPTLRERVFDEWHGQFITMLRISPELTSTMWEQHPEWVTQAVLTEAGNDPDALARLLSEFAPRISR